MCPQSAWKFASTPVLPVLHWPESLDVSESAHGIQKFTHMHRAESLFAALLFLAAKLFGSYSCHLYAGSAPTALTVIGVQIAGSGPQCLGKDE